MSGEGNPRWSKPIEATLPVGLSLLETFEHFRATLPQGARCAICTKHGRRYFVNFTLTPLAFTPLPVNP